MNKYLYWASIAVASFAAATFIMGYWTFMCKSGVGNVVKGFCGVVWFN